METIKKIRTIVPLLFLAACGHENNLPFVENTFDQPVQKISNSNNLNQNRLPSGPSAGASTPADAVTFVTFGDWGSGSSDQQGVADAIGRYCAANKCDFILTLGDNFYESGVSSTSDPLWSTRYHAIYDFLNLPFYVVIGNHDTYGNMQAEIDYSRIDPNWHLPAEQYTFSKPDGSASPLVQFFIFNSEPPHFDGPAQTALDQALSASSARWKLLAMHHPLYSNGTTHGDGDPTYRRNVISIICHRIDLVLSAHEHIFSYLQSSQDGCPIDQFIVGTGGQGLYGMNRSDPRMIFGSNFIHGFGWIQVTQNQIEFRMIDTTGRMFYQKTFTKP